MLPVERYCLVYEFMASGSSGGLPQLRPRRAPLPWYTRFRVAAEIASALLILHTRPVPIVHRDLKPGNILLDKNYVAKLGDVGLARLMPGLTCGETCMRGVCPCRNLRLRRTPSSNAQVSYCVPRYRTVRVS